MSPRIGDELWSQVFGLPYHYNRTPNALTSTITGADVEDYVFRWKVSNGICAESFDTVPLTIICISNLELTKEVAPNTADGGSRVSFTISILNDDTNIFVDAAGVEVTDVVPVGFTILGPISNRGTVSGASTITWSNLLIPI